MGFGLLAPVFLAGLTALAIPVLVHLVHKQDAAVKAFPSLMFLERAPSPLQRRREIRHWLLLALRCLAIVLIVLAFAQPVVERDPATAAAAAERRDLVLLLDRSYSMGYRDRWTRAQRAAQTALDALASGDRAALVYFDTETEVASELDFDHAAVAAALESGQPGWRATDIGAGLRRAVRLLEDSNAAVREIQLISDFQRSGWPRSDHLEVPEDIRVNAQEVGAAEAWNAAVWVAGLGPGPEPDSLALEVAVGGAREAGADPQQLTLSSDGTTIETRSLGSASGTGANARFVLPRPTRGTVKGELRIAADGLTADDSFRFAMRTEPSVPVLVLESVRPRVNQSAFLAQALRVSDTPRFDVKTVRQDQLEVADLGAAAIVVLNEAAAANRELERELLSFVEGGGGLLVVAGAAAATMARLGPDELTPELPALRRPPAAGNAYSVTWIDASHAAMQLFSGPGAVNLSQVRVSQYQPLVLGPADDVVARFDDGAPALVERRHGEGRILTLATTVDTHWGNLPLQPVFLPLMHELLKYLADFKPVPPWHGVGETVDVASYLPARPAADAPRSIRSIVVEAPGGRQIRLPAEAPLLRIDEPGWYELHAPGAEGWRELIAANVDPAESALAALPAAEFLTAIETVAETAPRARAERNIPSQQAPDDRRIWWYLLLLAATILAAETLVSNRLSSKA